MIEVENKNYIDVTEEWLNKENVKKGRVINRNYYIDKEDNKYKVDGKNVVLDYSIKEKEVAEWLITKFGGNIYMLPRVNYPKGIATADYLWKNEYWDLKVISNKATSRTRAVDNVIKTAKYQTNNIVLDITDTVLSKDIIIKQVEKIYNTNGREWLDKIIIIENYNLIRLYQKKPSPLQAEWERLKCNYNYIIIYYIPKVKGLYKFFTKKVWKK